MSNTEKDEFIGRYLRTTTQNRGGAILERVYVRSGVSVIPVTATGEIVLIKEQHFFTREIRQKVVTGYVEDGEDPLVCAKRELQEEVGIAATTWTKLFVDISRGSVNRERHYFLAEGLTEVTASPEPDERILGKILLRPMQVRNKVLEGAFGFDSMAFALLKVADWLMK